ncbi:MAG: carboxypeptidase-like regulatory domain-containing protein, partial [Bryobacteraceae bacterium]
MRFISGLFLYGLIVAAWPCAIGQSIHSGTVTGTVTDQSRAVIQGAKVELKNAVTGYSQATISDAAGNYRFNNVPQNQYVLAAVAQGFAPLSQTVDVRSALPVEAPLTLNVAGSSTEVQVQADANLVESDPTAHQDVDRGALQKLPALDPAAGLSQAITYSTGAVAADANGFFHPLGDHAQVSFVIDGQPISDQQSKVFSTQLPVSAVQGMELVTGMPMAEFGDKSSLIAEVTTRSALGAGRWFGNVQTNYGSFGATSSSVGLGYGNNKVGNFLALDGSRSSRFLDSPEFTPFHDIGNNETLFDRLDWQPDAADAFHFNLFLARNWIQIPNTYDQLAQDQHQRVLTWNIAPGYQHTFNPHALLTVNPYVRQDQFTYYASRDPFADTRETHDQSRRLMNYGLMADLC